MQDGDHSFKTKLYAHEINSQHKDLWMSYSNSSETTNAWHMFAVTIRYLRMSQTDVHSHCHRVIFWRRNPYSYSLYLVLYVLCSFRYKYYSPTPHQAHNINNFGRALINAIPQAITPNSHTNLLNVYIQIANKMEFQPNNISERASGNCSALRK
jgi:hypothetical protein